MSVSVILGFGNLTSEVIMKKRNSIFAVIAILLSLVYSLNSCKELSENDKVLQYYTSKDADSLKYKAAKFLLANIPYHFSLNNIAEESNEWELWRLETDSILKGLLRDYPYDGIPRDTINAIQALRDTLLTAKNLPEITTVGTFMWDSTFLTAEFLIQHIDNAFEVWQTSKYAKELAFDEFKEYILPYTSLRSYGFLTHGKRLNTLFAPLVGLDSAATITECIRRYNHNVGTLRGINGQNRRKGYGGLYDMYVHGAHECTDIAVWGCNILRACGIPVVVENVIGYRDFTGKHFHCCMYDSDSNNWYPFNAESSLPGNFSFESPVCLNVYRHLFAAQKNTPYFLRRKGEPVPTELSDPCIQDVTSQYMDVYSVTLPADTTQGNRLAYLAVFNAHSGVKATTWGAIDILTNSVTFENALTGILYLPVYCTKEGYKSFSSPFYLAIENGKAQVRHIPGVDKDTTTTSLLLTRKFPRKKRMIQVAEELVGGKFLGANKADFSDAVELYTITDAPQPQLKEYRFNRTGKYRYYRFQAPAQHPHANISHLEWISDSRYGYTNTGPATREHVLSPVDTVKGTADSRKVKLLDRDRERMTWVSEYDGNMQTAPGAYPSITLALDEPQVVTAVRFAPLNADNGIKAGNIYRLNYWDNGWKTVAASPAEYEYIEFKGVPVNKLYWLENLTEGKEEMPFVVIDGKQRFIYDNIITTK